MSLSHSHWYLLGAGSLGCLFAARMQRAGIATTLLLRNTTTAAASRTAGGITLEADGRTETIAIDTIALDAIPADLAIARLLICTKAHQTRAAVLALLPYLRADAAIVLLQNGMGVREEIHALLPHATIVNALSTEGAWRRSRFHIVHAGRGETLVGDESPQLTQQLSGIGMRAVADIEARLWRKLAVNCVINPLTALQRCRNGELLQLPAIAADVATICGEIAGVAMASGIALDRAELQQQVFNVMRTTADNRSSMLQDIDHRRRTEIDYLNGFVVDGAEHAGLVAPRNRELLCAIKSLEEHFERN